MMMRRGCLLTVTLIALAGRATGAQTVFDRTPNLAGGWVGSAGVVHFNFLHRFSISSAPEHKVTSAPTFLMAAGLPGNTLLGAHYATNSELSPRYPNEWEFFGRWAPFDQELGSPVDASIQAGYNLAAEGPDGEISLARRQGRFRVLGAFRLLAAPGDEGGTDVAVAGGAAFRLTRGVALAADVAALTERAPGEDVAWSAGVNFIIPHTPHSVSLHATNTNNATLQSSSRGTGETRYGFEFTIPVTLSRYFGGGGRADSVPPPTAPPPAAAGRDTVTAEVADFMFKPGRLVVAPGTTIVWTNGGQVAHTVTAEDGSFESGPIESGQKRAMLFAKPGTFPFHCTPHPFMKGEVIVR
jgi:plastocyanin